MNLEALVKELGHLKWSIESYLEDQGAEIQRRIVLEGGT